MTPTRELTLMATSYRSPTGVLAAAATTNVRGIDTFSDGVEYPRIRVTLTTGIDRELGERINLGYCDPRSIDVEAWRASADALGVDPAGQDLYRVREQV
jgi:hypothetical protein